MRKVALVTGATRGIGKAAALELAKRGFAVAVTGRTKKEGEGRLTNPWGQEVAVPGSIESTVREIEALGGEALGVVMDLDDRASIDRAVGDVVAKWGRIDGLFNNAMYQSPNAMRPISALTAEIAEEAFRTMFLNHLHITQRVLEPMLKQGAGRIVFISSGAGAQTCELKLEQGGWGMLYGAGKAAFAKLAEFVDLEYRDQGVSTFLVFPALTITEAMVAQFGDDARKLGGGGRVETPAQVGEVVAWMLDDPEAPKFAGPKLQYTPTFFEENGITRQKTTA